MIHLVYLRMLHKRTCRTYIYTLSALDTRAVLKRTVIRRRNKGIKSSVLETKDSESVCILTSFYTSSAEDTL